MGYKRDVEMKLREFNERISIIEGEIDVIKNRVDRLESGLQVLEKRLISKVSEAEDGLMEKLRKAIKKVEDSLEAEVDALRIYQDRCPLCGRILIPNKSFLIKVSDRLERRRLYWGEMPRKAIKMLPGRVEAVVCEKCAELLDKDELVLKVMEAARKSAEAGGGGDV